MASRSQCITLGELVVKLVRERKQSTPEFQSILTYYGREKLKKIYLDELEREKDLANQRESKTQYQKAIHDT